MKKILVVVLFLLVIPKVKAAELTPPPSSQSCIACHGAKGISNNPFWPNLAGQKTQYLEKQLQDFKAGRRLDPVMSPLAKILSDEEIKALSEYFSSL